MKRAGTTEYHSVACGEHAIAKLTDK